MLPHAISILTLLLISVAPAIPTTSAAESQLGVRILYTAAKTYDPLAWLKGTDRFSSDAKIFVSEGTTQRRLAPAFAETADPNVSFDGQRVLFAAKPQPIDSWQIWEVGLEEGNPRRVTQGTEDCIRPLYLPGDRIVYARKVDGRFVIETSDMSGASMLPLTYISSNSIPSDVLRDGRILFESGYPLGTDGPPEIYTVYSDGSGIESYRCDHGDARNGSKQAKSGDIVFTADHGLAKFTSAKAQRLSISAPVGDYAGDFAETASGEWLVSWRPNSLSAFRLMRWMPGSQQLVTVLALSDANLIQPTPIEPRAVPNRHPSGLHDWPNANLLCLNAYTSKYQFAQGSIASVRLYTRGKDGRSRLLGTAPVERDGSFFVQVPSDQPLQIELVDASGKSLKRESGFFWMRRGEQRGCVGCHAGPETAPENAVPMVLLKFPTPADVTESAAQSAGGH